MSRREVGVALEARARDVAPDEVVDEATDETDEVLEASEAAVAVAVGGESTSEGAASTRAAWGGAGEGCGRWRREKGGGDTEPCVK